MVSSSEDAFSSDDKSQQEILKLLRVISDMLSEMRADFEQNRTAMNSVLNIVSRDRDACERLRDAVHRRLHPELYPC